MQLFIRPSLVLAAALLVAASCARAPVAPQPHTAAQTLQLCRQFLAEVDKAVARAKVADTQAQSIGDFPYLRVDRFLASFRDEVLDDVAFNAWVQRLQRLAERGRRVELNNLPAEQAEALRQRLPSAFGEKHGLLRAASDCGQRLRAHDLATPEGRRKLREAIHVSPEYVTWKRAVGLYALTGNAVKAGINKGHEDTHGVYAQALEDLPIHGALWRYTAPAVPAPMTVAEIREVLRRSIENPLGIPEPTKHERARLFATFAPTWQVDVVTDDDRIGTPVWPGLDAPTPSINVQRPVVYRQLSHTRVKGEVLAQLNYVVWFPARPKTSSFDYLGGHLDGITWRVTLSNDGTPLLFDSMHNCGCYHMFFPTERLRLRSFSYTPEDDLFEPPLVPQVVNPPAGGLTLRIAHRTHYIERVTDKPVPEGGVSTYSWAAYEALRSLPVDNRYRSLFRPDGVVPGTKRGERWFLWPTGVPHPGEMRQWGHHATAFVGRRHFDDPYLIETLFELNTPQAATR